MQNIDMTMVFCLEEASFFWRKFDRWWNPLEYGRSH